MVTLLQRIVHGGSYSFFKLVNVIQLSFAQTKQEGEIVYVDCRLRSSGILVRIWVMSIHHKS